MTTRACKSSLKAYTKAKNAAWDNNYILETMWLFYCKDDELFDLPLSQFAAYDDNQKTVLSHRIGLTQALREEQWQQNWLSSPPKKETIGSLLASDRDAFELTNLIQV